MRLILAGMEWRNCFVCIWTISWTYDKHIEHLREVFERLRSAGLHLKPIKCLLLRDEVPYLGHVIPVHGIQPESSKTE